MFESAKWITAPKRDINPCFKKRFAVKKAVTAADLSVTAAGLYKLYINGENKSYGLYNPGWTHYDKRTQYQTYDLTDLLREENTVEIVAAGGWALANLHRAGDHFFSDRICVIAELRLAYADGTEELIRTDETWEVYTSQVLFSHVYHGEIIDYSAEPAFLGNAEIADIRTAPVPQEGRKVSEQERVAAKKLFVTPQGETVIDFGQNLAGYVEIRVKGRRGDRVKIRHAEILDTDGNFYVKNLRTARQAMEYVLGADGESVLKPQFTFQGYRYIAIDEYPGDIDPASFTSVAVYTDMKRTGSFFCGNSKLNKLYQSIVWTQRSNSIDVPTDCPQRDERLGWLGDAEFFCPSAAFNYDVFDFYAKWLNDIATGQLPNGAIRATAPYNPNGNPANPAAGWSDAIIIIPYEMYRVYGDKSLIERHFDAMCRWIDYMRAWGEEEYLWLDHFQYGDWLALDGPNPRDPLTDKNFSSSAFFAYSTGLVVTCGRIIGRDVSEYEALYRNVRQAFRARFLKDGLPTTDTMTGCILLLKFGLLDEGEHRKVAEHLVELLKKHNNKVCTGMYGTTYILPILSEYGYTKLAYDLLLEEGSPSWLGMITHGGTTMWERLDIVTDEGLKDVFNASFNHYAFGAVQEWLVKGPGGLDIAEEGAGYSSIAWKPLVDPRLGHVHVEFESVNGRIDAHWMILGDEVTFDILVPQGVCAHILLPNGQEYRVKGGHYHFVLPLNSCMPALPAASPA